MTLQEKNSFFLKQKKPFLSQILYILVERIPVVDHAADRY